MNPSLQQFLRFSQRINRIRQILGLLLCTVATLAVLAVIAVWDRWLLPLQESLALALSGLVLLTAGISTGIIQRIAGGRYRITPNRIAARIERRFPAFNDVLTTAIFLHTSGKAPLNSLEQQVVKQAAEQLQNHPWAHSIRHPWEKAGAAILLLALSFVLGFAVLSSNAFHKATYALGDLLRGRSTGIEIHHQASEVPVGADASVSIQIHRWQLDAKIEIQSAHAIQREPVVIDANGSGSFTFYSLSESLRFRVVTPALRSGWQSIATFVPPRIDSLNLQITPPAYTRLPDSTFTGLRDLEIIEGTRIDLELQSATAASVDWLSEDGPTSAAASNGNRFTVSLSPHKSGSYALRLADPYGRIQQTATRTISVMPDLPPLVEIIQPRRDVTFAPDDQVPLQLFVADDFGVGEIHIHLSLSGTAIPTLSLPLDSFRPKDDEGNALPLKEAEPGMILELARFFPEDGDILAVFAEVFDNREPLRQSTRSDLLFIEIRTPVPPEEIDGMPMDQREIDLRTLIAEQKRLLRESHRLLSVPETTRAALINPLAAELSTLGNEMQRIYRELEGDLEAAGRWDLINLFEAALEDNGAAIESIRTRRLADSVPPQTASISALLRIENALRQNTVSREPAEGKSGEGSAESDESSDAQQSESGSDQQAEKLQALKSELEAMIQRQNELNSRFERGASTAWTTQQQADAAAAQAALATSVNALRSALESFAETRPIRDSLALADQQMRAAGSHANGDNPAGALRSGLRARESLRSAMAGIDSLAADLASRELSQAADAAARLAAQQGAAAQASSAAAGGDPATASLDDLETRQRQLNQRMEALMQTLQDRAHALQGDDPQVSLALREAVQSTNQRGTGARMERAANALLYGQPGAASSLQQQAASDLQEMAGQLEAAREAISSDPMRRAAALGRELATTLEELASYARNRELAQEGRIDRLRQDWTRRMEELQQMSGNRQFGQLANAIAGSGEMDWDSQLGTTRAILFEAAGLLQEFLMQGAIDSGARFNREAAPPPDRYRRQVEDYFRRLATEVEAP